MAHTLAFEIGTEEIPAFDLDSANKQLEKMVPELLDAARIPYERIEIAENRYGHTKRADQLRPLHRYSVIFSVIT